MHWQVKRLLESNYCYANKYILSYGLINELSYVYIYVSLFFLRQTVFSYFPNKEQSECSVFSRKFDVYQTLKSLAINRSKYEIRHFIGKLPSVFFQLAFSIRENEGTFPAFKSHIVVCFTQILQPLTIYSLISRSHRIDNDHIGWPANLR